MNDEYSIRKSNFNKLPLEILDIIEQFLSPYQLCFCHNQQVFYHYVNFLKTNKLFYNRFFKGFDCFSRNKLTFEGKIWCEVHNIKEYNLALEVIKTINNTNDKINSNLIMEPDGKNKFFIHPQGLNFFDNINKLFHKVCPRNIYQIKHTCCNGKGICFTIK